MRIVFMGTPDFALPCLEALIEKGHNICAVVTQPDRPKGRGHKLMPPPVKELAERLGIKVYQPEKVKTKDFVDILKSINPEMIVVVAFGQILSKEILDIPKYGCINVHASLLPKYRGAAPINWSIINGEKVTGITTMFMAEGLDTGDIILKREISIDDSDNAKTLHDKLSVLGAKVLIDTVSLFENNKVVKIPQEEIEASYAKMLDKSTGRIEWSNDANSIFNQIRGVTPWPGAYTTYNGKMMKVFMAKVVNCKFESAKCGEIIDKDRTSFTVFCGDNCLKILEIQFESEKRMTVEEYLKGHEIEKGNILI